VWTLVNPDLFIPLVDILEDVMQASIPNFIHSVKVSDIGQGDNSIRVLSVRHLPPTDEDQEVNEEHGIDREQTSQEELKWGHYVVFSQLIRF